MPDVVKYFMVMVRSRAESWEWASAMGVECNMDVESTGSGKHNILDRFQKKKKINIENFQMVHTQTFSHYHG